MTTLSETELAKLTDGIHRKLEPMIRREIERSMEESLSTLFAYLGDELSRFAKMRKQGDI